MAFGGFTGSLPPVGTGSLMPQQHRGGYQFVKSIQQPTDLRPNEERYSSICHGPKCATEPPRCNHSTYNVGTEVEVYSKTEQCWCRGVVEEVKNGGTVMINFRTPSGMAGNKILAIGCSELRLPLCQRATPIVDKSEQHGDYRRQGGDVTLPPGWESTVDAASGDTYYFNRSSGEVSWDHPSGRVSQVSLAASSRRNLTSSVAARTLLDTQEDVVVPAEGKIRVANLSMKAILGADTMLILSHNEHGFEPMDVGARFEYNSQASQIANTVVQRAMDMAASVAQEQRDLFDHQWQGPGGKDCLMTLLNVQSMEAAGCALERLTVEVQQILACQPTLVKAQAPAKVYGDIHGQFRDMLLSLHYYGFPEGRRQGPSIIFNGDWADRGKHQLEVICLVFALKVVYPDNVWLLRGNHEDALLNQTMGRTGFHAHCLQRLNQRVFAAVHQAFSWLPIGCLLNRSILVVHGGIGDGNWSLDQLEAIKRPLDSNDLPRNRLVYNILWSDPLPEEGWGANTCGVHDSPRDRHQNLVVTFGRDVTERFCAHNRLDLVIRSHQTMVGGYGYDAMHGGRLVRVFSARDYEGAGNDGAILSITERCTVGLILRPQVVRSFAVPKPDD